MRNQAEGVGRRASAEGAQKTLFAVIAAVVAVIGVVLAVIVAVIH